MAIIARAAEGWIVIAPGCGLNPFSDIRNLAFFNDAALLFEIHQNDDWVNILVTTAGMQRGNIIRTGGRVVGSAHFKGTEFDIYLK